MISTNRVIPFLLAAVPSLSAPSAGAHPQDHILLNPPAASPKPETIEKQLRRFNYNNGEFPNANYAATEIGARLPKSRLYAISVFNHEYIAINDPSMTSEQALKILRSAESEYIKSNGKYLRYTGDVVALGAAGLKGSIPIQVTTAGLGIGLRAGADALDKPSSDQLFGRRDQDVQLELMAVPIMGEAAALSVISNNVNVALSTYLEGGTAGTNSLPAGAWSARDVDHINDPKYKATLESFRKSDGTIDPDKFQTYVDEVVSKSEATKTTQESIKNLSEGMNETQLALQELENKDDKRAEREALQAKQAEDIEKYRALCTEVQSTYNDINSGLAIASQFTAFIKDEKTKQNLTATIGCASFVNKVRFNLSCNALGIEGFTDLAAFTNVVSAASELFKLFSNQPSPEQQILKEVQNLREDIYKLGTHIDTRFDQLDKKLDALIKAVDLGINEIIDRQKLSLEYSKEILASVRDVQEQLGFIERKIDGLYLKLSEKTIMKISRKYTKDAFLSGFLPTDEGFVIDLTEVQGFVIDDANTAEICGLSKPNSTRNPSFVFASKDLRLPLGFQADFLNGKFKDFDFGEIVPFENAALIANILSKELPLDLSDPVRAELRSILDGTASIPHLGFFIVGSSVYRRAIDYSPELSNRVVDEVNVSKARIAPILAEGEKIERFAKLMRSPEYAEYLVSAYETEAKELRTSIAMYREAFTKKHKIESVDKKFNVWFDAMPVLGRGIGDPASMYTPTLATGKRSQRFLYGPAPGNAPRNASVDVTGFELPSGYVNYIPEPYRVAHLLGIGELVHTLSLGFHPPKFDYNYKGPLRTPFVEVMVNFRFNNKQFPVFSSTKRYADIIPPTDHAGQEAYFRSIPYTNNPFDPSDCVANVDFYSQQKDKEGLTAAIFAANSFPAHRTVLIAELKALLQSEPTNDPKTEGDRVTYHANRLAGIGQLMIDSIRIGYPELELDHRFIDREPHFDFPRTLDEVGAMLDLAFADVDPEAKIYDILRTKITDRPIDVEVMAGELATLGHAFKKKDQEIYELKKRLDAAELEVVERADINARLSNLVSQLEADRLVIVKYAKELGREARHLFNSDDYKEKVQAIVGIETAQTWEELGAQLQEAEDEFKETVGIRSVLSEARRLNRETANHPLLSDELLKLRLMADRK